VSNPLTMAPIARAEPAAAKPATPPPMINTCQSEQPYCKIQILKLTEKSNLGKYDQCTYLHPRTGTSTRTVEMYSNESSKLKIRTDTVDEGAQRAATEANTY